VSISNDTVVINTRCNCLPNDIQNYVRLRLVFRRNDWDIVSSSHDTTAVAVVILVFSVIIVPVCVVVTLINGNVCAIDAQELAEQSFSASSSTNSRNTSSATTAKSVMNRESVYWDGRRSKLH